MRAVFVSQVHPASPHVSGQRCANFARAMAGRGHEILLLTQVLETHSHGTELGSLAGALAEHAWDDPFHVEVPHRRSPLGEAIRQGKLPALVRRPLAALQLLGPGPSPEWSLGARNYVGPIVEGFRPDVVWTIFGSISDLLVGQRIARTAYRPYVIDFKDDWSKFIPAPLREPLATRFRDAAAYTSNARQYRDVAARWFPARESTVVYSGVARAMMAPLDLGPDRQSFRVSLIGSFYRRENLWAFLDAFRKWLQTRSADERLRIELAYAGTEHAQFDAAASGLPCSVQTHAYLSQPELAKLCWSSAANCYLWMPAGFHHKLLELLACRRPIISFPGELDESMELARRFNGQLHRCYGGAAVSAALEWIWSDWLSGNRMSVLDIDAERIGWDGFVVELERALAEAVAGNGAAERQ